ncbi:hypothetical protein N9K35_03310 [Pseudomonadales bacterium]|nr:hypothetical protein [Pseudomonadales bacterium]
MTLTTERPCIAVHGHITIARGTPTELRPTDISDQLAFGSTAGFATPTQLT